MRVDAYQGMYPLSAHTLPASSAESAQKHTVSTPSARTDRVELSEQAVRTMERTGYLELDGIRAEVPEDLRKTVRDLYDRVMASNEALQAWETVKETQNASQQEIQRMEKEAKTMRIMMEIARRIAKGGIVPRKDEKALLAYSPQMYLSAKLQAVSAKEHKKYKTLLEDEEEGTADTGAAEETPGPSKVEASVSVDGDSAQVTEISVCA